MAKSILVLEGDRFGSLVVQSIYRVPNARGQLVDKAICNCDCGGTLDCWKYNLTSGHTVRCRNCAKELIGKAKVTHGNTKGRIKTTTYTSWVKMWERVRHPQSSPCYDGVTACDRWLKFENFLADMGQRPDGKTLDRLDSNLGYSLDNCRWATPQEQSANRRFTGKDYKPAIK